jgi:heme-degrading monooxygenase HmoA
MTNTLKSKRIFRIDRFIVPAASEIEFLNTVAETNSVFDAMAGCVQRHVLKQQRSSSEAVFLTVVEWESVEAIQKAREAVVIKHAKMGLDPQEMFQRLNIQADLGTFVPAFESE